jgi:hypothetical protein
VKLDSGELLGWLSSPWYEPPTSLHDGLWLADISASPTYFTQWPDVLHVTDCRIATGYTYDIQAVAIGADIGDEGAYSEAVSLPTSAVWGDVVASCAGGTCAPPDGIVGLSDIMACISKYQGVDVAPITWLDTDPSNGDDTPDRNIGIGDILRAIEGYQGGLYPGLPPLSCP